MDEKWSLDLLRAVVGQVTVLGPNNFGLCPFHDEKTASFNIFCTASGKAKFHCFGCGAGGDIFDFLHRKRHLPFPRARIWLANFMNSDQAPSSPSSSPSGHPGTKRECQDPEIGASPFCELDCPQYANLREDYNTLLAENHKLRELLGMDEFRPSNEG